MPKDVIEKVEEPKKKVVVVEEVSEDTSETPKETPKAELQTEVSKVEPVELVDVAEKTNYLWIIVPTALLVGALVGGLITYFSGISKLNSEPVSPTPVASITPSVEATPTASPSSTLKKDDLKVQILNGSGVSGAAGKVKTLLEGLGYKLIDTGNASMSDLAQTEVSLKDSKKDYFNEIIKDLSKSYTATESAKTLSGSSKYDVVITLGKK